MKFLVDAHLPHYFNANQMKRIVIAMLVLLPTFGVCQNGYNIETTDITNFWDAFDDLKSAETKADSIKIIQEEYIDKSTAYFKEFIKARNFTAEEYVELIRRYPKFWRSVRPLTENIVNRKAEIEKVFEQYRSLLPGFEQPDVCFAIGCLRTGGTTTKDLILIGSEIAASNEEVDKSEMSGWLESVIGNTGDIVSMIAHETVHTQQYNRRRYKLLTGVMTEGIADFFTVELLGLNINKEIFEYGNKHKCELFREFESDLKSHPKEYNRWIYQGNKAENRPADLGYFIGYQIAKMYYDKSESKTEALLELLNVKRYEKIFEMSGFSTESCN